MNITTRSFISAVGSGCFLVLTASPVSIGVIQSNGDFRVDGSAVNGNSTLFDGSVVETHTTRSEIQLSNGAKFTLTPDSRAKVYHDRTVLEKGTGVVKNSASWTLEAGSLRIVPAAKNSIVQVGLDTPKNVVVSARSGEADVRTASGQLVARVFPGTALAFDPPQAGAAASVMMSGTLRNVNGNYLLTDATTNVTVQLQGTGLDQYVGKQVTVSGSIAPGATPVAGATEVVQVVNISTGRGGRTAAAAAGAGAGAGAAAAIVAGVVVAGTLGGLAAAGTFSGTSGPSSPPTP